MTLRSALFLLALCTGCGGPQPTSTDEPLDPKLSVLARLYGEYAARHQGRAPPDEAAFKEFLRGLPESQRKSMKLDDLEQAFVSPRDGKPFVFRYGASARGPGLQGQPIVAHEQVGKHGKRAAATAMGTTAELSETAFRQAVSQ